MRTQNKQLIVKKFRCYRYGSISPYNEMQGVLFPDGHVEIGIDVWRNLSRIDCASYPVERYRTLTDAKDKYAFNKRSRYVQTA